MLTAKPYISVHRYQICVERYGGSIIIFYFQEVQGGYEVNLHLLSPGPVYWAWLVRSRRKIDIQDHSSDITFATSTLCTLPISSFNPLGNYARVATGGDSVFGFCMVAGSHLPPQTTSNQPAYAHISCQLFGMHRNGSSRAAVRWRGRSPSPSLKHPREPFSVDCTDRAYPSLKQDHINGFLCSSRSSQNVWMRSVQFTVCHSDIVIILYKCVACICSAMSTQVMFVMLDTSCQLSKKADADSEQQNGQEGDTCIWQVAS